NQFLHDIKLVPTAEPYKKRTSHGLILGTGGIKMSKSKGNVVNPDEVVRRFGADALRLYEMFIGPFDQHASWNSHGIVGTRRFLERVYKLISNFQTPISKQIPNSKSQTENHHRLERILHQTIKKVSEDVENLRMNTAVSSLMILLNEMESLEIDNWKLEISCKKTFLQLLAPFAPHVTEELWQSLGEKKSIHTQPWPQFDKKKIKKDTFMLVVQVNGRVRAIIEVSAGISQSEAEQLALSHERVINQLDGKKPARIIYVPGKLINFVLS
ncbi:MAG: leucyl-tRNA synthetase, partial [Parcubacteria group bacterium Gr01-1014_70]